LKQTRILIMGLSLVMVIAFVYLMTDYARQHQRQAALMEQIGITAQALSVLPTPAANLEQQLADITASNAKASAAIGDVSLNTTKIIDSLLSLAESCQLQVTPLSSSAWGKHTLENTVYKTLPIELQIQGSISGLIDYIDALDNTQKYPNLIITEMNVNDVAEQRLPGDDNDKLVTAKIFLSIIVRLPPGS
jgi:hypothetical protein